jgi:hypothetical protein
MILDTVRVTVETTVKNQLFATVSEGDLRTGRMVAATDRCRKLVRYAGSAA